MNISQLLKFIRHCANGLINNAGLARPANMDNIDKAELMWQVNTSFVDTVMCCKPPSHYYGAKITPRIINISSASAWHYDETFHLSICASIKAAVERFTRDLRLEAQTDGIGVTCLRPGAAWTNFADGWNEERLRAGADAWQNAGPTMDSGMEPEHIAEAVIYCLAYPGGVAVDLLEARLKQPISKLKL